MNFPRWDDLPIFARYELYLTDAEYGDDSGRMYVGLVAKDGWVAYDGVGYDRLASGNATGPEGMDACERALREAGVLGADVVVTRPTTNLDLLRERLDRPSPPPVDDVANAMAHDYMRYGRDA